MCSAKEACHKYQLTWTSFAKGGAHAAEHIYVPSELHFEVSALQRLCQLPAKQASGSASAEQAPRMSMNILFGRASAMLLW